jgi:DNA repair exonuclease SbcCD ATPase subunit
MSTTLYFRELSIRNFLSFGNNETIIDFTNPVTIFIEGRNLDSSFPGSSNGCGKTAIINALCYVIYNKPFDNISLQRLINTTNATKNTLMEVSISFERGSDEYFICRTRGEQHSISIMKNGIDITPGKGVSECDAMIQDIIGISYELFTKTIIFSGNSQPFLQLPIAQQRSQIEELFNITLLSEKAVLLREQIKQTESDIKIQEAVLNQQTVALELHNKHIADAEYRYKNWEASRSREIANIEGKLEALNSVDFDSEQMLHSEKADLVQMGAHINAKLHPICKEHELLTKSIEKLLQEQQHLNEAKCPYCSQAFANSKEKLTEINNKIEQQGLKLIDTELSMSELQLEAKTQSERLKEVTGKIKHSNLSELLAIRENASVLRAKLAELTNASNPHADALEKLLNEPAPKLNTDKIDALRRRNEHQAFLLKLLVGKDSFIRRRIINRSIPFLNERINNYTKKLGLPHIVQFDSDMSCTVSEFGRELDFGNLSAGEKKRVNTALALSFRDVLHHLHAKTNILLIDELDGQLDTIGMDSIIRILKDKSRDDELSIFVISHHPSIHGRLDKTLVIQKENGFSTILDS